MAVVTIRKSQMVEIPVPATSSTQTRFNFPDQPQLRSMRIDGVEAFCVADMTHAPSQNVLITMAMMQFAYLTLYVQNADVKNAGRENMGEYINQIPLVSIHRVAQGTNAYVRDLMGMPSLSVDWSKSYVTTGQPLGNGTPVSFLFNVFYRFIAPPKA